MGPFEIQPAMTQLREQFHPPFVQDGCQQLRLSWGGSRTKPGPGADEVEIGGGSGQVILFRPRLCADEIHFRQPQEGGIFFNGRVQRGDLILVRIVICNTARRHGIDPMAASKITRLECGQQRVAEVNSESQSIVRRSRGRKHKDSGLFGIHARNSRLQLPDGLPVSQARFEKHRVQRAQCKITCVRDHRIRIFLRMGPVAGIQGRPREQGQRRPPRGTYPIHTWIQQGPIEIDRAQCPGGILQISHDLPVHSVHGTLRNGYIGLTIRCHGQGDGPVKVHEVEIDKRAHKMGFTQQLLFDSRRQVGGTHQPVNSSITDRHGLV